MDGWMMDEGVIASYRIVSYIFRMHVCFVCFALFFVCFRLSERFCLSHTSRITRCDRIG